MKFEEFDDFDDIDDNGVVLTKRMEMAKQMLKKEKERHTALQKRYKELLRQWE